MEGSDASFMVTLSQSVDAEVIVSWSALLGTDDAESSDLVSVSGTVTFAANSAAGATRTIAVTAADDLLPETAETFTVTLVDVISTLSSQVSLKSGSESAAAKIEESDPITIELRGPDTVNEGEAVTYTVFLSDDPLQAWFIDDTPRTGINTCSKEDWTEDPGCRETEISGLDSGTAYVVEIRTHHAVGVSQWTTIVNTHRPN